MKFTRASEYALLAVAHLAKQAEDVLTSTRSISEDANIPTQFLSKILPKLSAAGLIHSIPGQKGGHCLARSASDIHFHEIIEAVEGPIVCANCHSPSGGGCERVGHCGIKHVIDEVQNLISSYLKGVTIAQIICPAAKPLYTPKQPSSNQVES